MLTKVGTSSRVFFLSLPLDMDCSDCRVHGKASHRNTSSKTKQLRPLLHTHGLLTLWTFLAGFLCRSNCYLSMHFPSLRTMVSMDFPTHPVFRVLIAARYQLQRTSCLMCIGMMTCFSPFLYRSCCTSYHGVLMPFS